MKKKVRTRTEQYLLALLPEEKAMLAKNSQELGLSKAEYLRKMIVHGKVAGQNPVIDKKQGEQLLHEVTRIANSISRIDYNTNERNYAIGEDWKQIRDLSFEILALLGKLVDMDKENFEKWQQQVSIRLEAQ